MRWILVLAFSFTLCLLTGCGGENNKTDVKSVTAPPPGSGLGKKIPAVGAPTRD
jgi:hypothetical protein